MSNKVKIEMSISKFVVVDGKAIDKHSDFFGGFYYYDELPAGKLLVKSGSVIDQIGKIRDGNGSEIITTRDELLKKSEEGIYW